MKVFAAALTSVLVATMPTEGRTATESMGSLSEWTVSLVVDAGGAFCSFEWDSQVGETVEIRAGLKDIEMLIADSAWNLPDKQSTRIQIRGRKSSTTVTAVATDRTTLQVVGSEGNAMLIRSIVRSAVKGTVDIDFSFAGNEPDWTVPISRIFSMHDTVTSCLQELYKPKAHKDPHAPQQPF